MRYSWPILFFLIVVCSCKKVQAPEDLLTEFVNYRFSKEQDMDKLLSYTTGDLRSNLEAFVAQSKDLHETDATESQTDQSKTSSFLDTGKLKKRSFKITLKKCDMAANSASTPREICYITYIITFDQFDKRLDEGHPEKDFFVEVKKIATLEKQENGNWLISDVNNIKTYIDSEKGIEP